MILKREKRVRENKEYSFYIKKKISYLKYIFFCVRKYLLMCYFDGVYLQKVYLMSFKQKVLNCWYWNKIIFYNLLKIKRKYYINQ